jgi:tRNA G18 (ribose-2'-O)-methylase SpoU
LNTATDNRNVIDYYKYWNEDAIRASLDKIRFPFIVAIENFDKDFNISTTIRNCNAFTGKEIWILGRKRWDRRGAVGTYHYEHLKFGDSISAVKDAYPDHRVVVFENYDEAVDIREYEWHENTIMVFGQESIGVTDEALDLADDVVYIPQFGSTRSLNVGVASGIAMYSYVERFGA